MSKKLNPVAQYAQVVAVFVYLRKAIPFAIENKLWTGFFQHRWMTVFSIVVSVIFSYAVISNLSHSLFGESTEMISQSLVDMGQVADGLKEEGRKSFFSGGMKYLLLILLEVVIFYFCIKTLASLQGREVTFTMKDFIKAEKRMIKVMVINYFFALMIHLLLNIVLAIFGFEFLKPILLFLVYAYFLGYAFLDNYFEQKGMTIKESRAEIWQHVGAATSLGAVATVLLFLPLIGPLLTPILFAIAATLYCAEAEPLTTETGEAVSQPAS